MIYDRMAVLAIKNWKQYPEVSEIFGDITTYYEFLLSLFMKNEFKEASKLFRI